MYNILYILHIIITITAFAIAYITGRIYINNKNKGIKNFSLFYVMITLYGIVMVYSIHTGNTEIMSWGHMLGRVAIFIGLIFISKTSLFTTNIKLSKILPFIWIAMGLGAITTFIIFIVFGESTTILADGSIQYNINYLSGWLIGISTAVAGIMWASIIYSNMSGATEEMTRAVRLKARILAISGLAIGIGYSLFYIVPSIKIGLIGISLTLFGYTAKLIVFSLWKYLKLDETSYLRDVI